MLIAYGYYRPGIVDSGEQREWYVETDVINGNTLSEMIAYFSGSPLINRQDLRPDFTRNITDGTVETANKEYIIGKDGETGESIERRNQNANAAVGERIEMYAPKLYFDRMPLPPEDIITWVVCKCDTKGIQRTPLGSIQTGSDRLSPNIFRSNNGT